MVLFVVVLTGRVAFLVVPEVADEPTVFVVETEGVVLLALTVENKDVLTFPGVKVFTKSVFCVVEYIEIVGL